MDLIESFALLKKSKFNVAEYHEITSEEDLKAVFPCVLKITEGHKTDVDGVFLNINTMHELKKTYKELKKSGKRIVQQKQISGIEIVIGIVEDPTFGRTIMFGLGGIFVEVIEDVSFRVSPITEKDAEQMISELDSKDVLYGKRGKKVDINLLKKLLVDVSDFAEKFNVNEMDLNPVILTEKNYFIVDARMK